MAAAARSDAAKPTFAAFLADVLMVFIAGLSLDMIRKKVWLRPWSSPRASSSRAGPSAQYRGYGDTYDSAPDYYDGGPFRRWSIRALLRPAAAAGTATAGLRIQPAAGSARLRLRPGLRSGAATAPPDALRRSAPQAARTARYPDAGAPGAEPPEGDPYNPAPAAPEVRRTRRATTIWAKAPAARPARRSKTGPSSRRVRSSSIRQRATSTLPRPTARRCNMESGSAARASRGRASPMSSVSRNGRTGSRRPT